MQRGCEDLVMYLIRTIHCDTSIANANGQLPLDIMLQLGSNHDIVKLLCPSSSSEVNDQDSEGNTPLHMACTKELEDLVVYLIDEVHCDINFTNSRNELPLHIAIRNGLRFDTLVLLVSQLNKDIQTIDGDTPLHLACVCKQEVVVRYLVEAMRCDTSIANTRKLLPLHIAITMGLSFDIIKLVSSCNVNAPTDDGNTPLHLACKRNKKKIVSYLINDLHYDTSIANDNGELPLHISLQFASNLDILKLLCPSSSEVNTQDSDGDTPLHIACRKGSEDLVVYLIDEVHCDVNFTNSRNELPLHIAIRKGLKFDTLVLLVSQVNKDIQTIDGDTPLHLACVYKQEVVVRYLVEAMRCDTSIANANGELPLHISLRLHSSVDIQKRLCPSSSMCNTQDNGGNTPLHIACKSIERGCEDLVVYLINDMHCDTTIPNCNGELPLHIAVACKASPLTVVQLASYCPVINAETSCFPVQLADDPVTVKLLEYVQNFPQMEPSMKQGMLIEYLLEKEFYTEYSFLDTAYKQGHYELVRSVILHSGLSINLYARDSSGKLAVSSHGDTLLHLACAKGDLELFTFLFGMKQTFKDIRNNEGKLPLHCAAASSKHSLEMVKVLDNSHVNQHTVEALHIACHCRNLDVADYLMVERQCSVFLSGQSELTGAVLEEMYGYGSDWNVSSTVRTGDTLLHLCCRMNCQELSTYLVVEKQFNPSVVNTFKELPFHIACRVRVDLEGKHSSS